MMRRALVLALTVVACDETPAAPSTAADPGKGGADGFTEYKRKSMASEAKVRLNQIARAAQQAMLEEHMGADGQIAPPSAPAAAPLTPAKGACCGQPNQQCAPTKADWDHPTWRTLGFEMFDPHRYSYAFEPTADGFVATAVGDLDCDGTFATYELRGTLQNGEVKLAEPTSTDPLE